MPTINNTSVRYLDTAGVEPIRQWHGVYAAKVTNNADPKSLNRVKMLVPQVLGLAESNWAYPLGFTGGFGPAVGSVVHAMFLGGDPRYPVYQTIAQPPVIDVTTLNASGAVNGGTLAGSTLATTGNVTIGGNLVVTGTSTFSGTIASLNVTGNATIGGLTKTHTFQMTNGAANNDVLTSDAAGNGTWQTPTVSGVGGVAPPLDLTQANTTGGILQVTNTATPTFPDLIVNANASGDLCYGADVSGDAQMRFTVDSNGKLQWGTGSGGPDAFIARSGAGQIDISTALQIRNGSNPGTPTAGTKLWSNGGTLTVNPESGGGMAMSSNASFPVLTLTNTTSAPAFPTMFVNSNASGDMAYGGDVSGDSGYRFVIDSNGQIKWGTGSGGQDTYLLRDGAGQMTLNGFSGNPTGPTFQILDGSKPSAPGGGTKLWSNGGNFNYVGEDGNNWSLGQITLRNTTNQTGFGTTMANITGLSLALVVGLYHIFGVITMTNAGSGTQTMAIGSSGAAMANMRVSATFYDLTNNAYKGGGQLTGQNQSIGTNSGNAAGVNVYAWFDGILNVSANGTFAMQAGIVGTGPMTVNSFSYITYVSI